MKVLWITNVALPEASRLIGEEVSPFGGWLDYASDLISHEEYISLNIAFPVNRKNYKNKYDGEEIIYYPFHSTNISTGNEQKKQIESILQEVRPDIVHIYGTEFDHSLHFAEVCKMKNIKFVVSIQGLVSVYSQHYMANLPCKVQLGLSIKDLFKSGNLHKQKKLFEERGINEIKTIKLSNNIIGRTTWDKACINIINQGAKYHFCNETLRKSFYNVKWDYEKCDKYSIFVSQGQYPIKGFHYILEALPLIIKKYPETKVYISGINITKYSSLTEKLKISYYGLYLRKLIQKNNLEDKIVFTGILSEEQMIDMYLKTNVVACPSAIENSPNSVGEAMILGVPCVASYVGGIPDLMEHNKEGFVYQGDAPYMLAHYICELFSNKEKIVKTSENAKFRAKQTHNPIDNKNTLINIYKDIIDEK